jgi:pyrroloquinoline quinone (PQQ) biosynthesis protein C
MKYLDHRQSEIDRDRWEAYKELELVTDAIDRPDRHRGGFNFGIDRVWRTLIALLVDELVTEQQVDYLDRCWDANEGNRSPSQTLQQFLTLIS